MESLRISRKMTNVEHIHQRSAAYGIPGMFIEDGNNVIDVYEGFKKAVDHVRGGNGPVLIESVTYRWLGHSSSDLVNIVRVKKWNCGNKKDPIENLRNYLIENNIASAEELEEIQAQVKEAVEAFCLNLLKKVHSHRLNQPLKIFTQTKEKEIKWKQKQCPSVTPLSLLCLRKCVAMKMYS